MLAGVRIQVPRIEIESKISEDQELVSRELLTMEGVNYELLLLVKMSAPTKWYNQKITEWPLGTELFTSTILLFGLFPVDLHRFKLKDINCNGFQEESSSLVNREWNHKRTITTQDSGCIVADVVEYVPKISLLGKLMKPVYKAIFSHRHKRLKAKYGGSS